MVVYYAEYQGDLVLTCEVSLGDGGAGFITRLDGRTLRIKWKRWIPSFNIEQGLVEDDSAYVTAHGFVGKVNLKSGVFVWKHDDLFRDGDTFNAFELPRVEREAVLFKEETIYNPPAKTIKVHKQSGEIKSIGYVVWSLLRPTPGMHPTPRHDAAHGSCTGARVMPGVGRLSGSDK